MSAGCCSEKRFDGASAAYKRALWIVILLNGSMFGVEIMAGLLAQSQALQADALDFLGDTATYTISLLVIGRSLQVRSSAALFKGLTLSIMGVWVLASTCYRIFVLNSPEPLTMGGVALLALLVNLVSLLILIGYRDGDANVRSVWLCSRNDAIGNVAVMIAASGVWYSQTAWPDLLVAGIMAVLFLSSSVQIIRQAMQEKRTALAQSTN